MSTRLRQQNQRNHEQALAAFVSRKAEIDAMLTRLQALGDDHFNYSPDEINWSHVGILEHYAELLKRLTDSAFQEGEMASMPTEPASPADARMITFVAIAPDGTSERLRFETRAEAATAADAYRDAGHSICWRGWSGSLQRWVSIPED